MRDFQIRQALGEALAREHKEEADTLILPEFGLPLGVSRIDVAVVNGSLSGYEIKSDHDTLGRLPKQIDAYNKCFDMMTLVTGPKHKEKATALIPKWWGVVVATESVEGANLNQVRKPRQNKTIEAGSIAALLWREELRAIISRTDNPPKMSKMTRPMLAGWLASFFSTDEVCRLVREAIKARGDWRSDPSPFRDDSLSRSCATSERSPANRRWLLSQRSENPRS